MVQSVPLHGCLGEAQSLPGVAFGGACGPMQPSGAYLCKKKLCMTCATKQTEKREQRKKRKKRRSYCQAPSRIYTVALLLRPLSALVIGCTGQGPSVAESGLVSRGRSTYGLAEGQTVCAECPHCFSTSAVCAACVSSSCVQHKMPGTGWCAVCAS